MAMTSRSRYNSANTTQSRYSPITNNNHNHLYSELHSWTSIPQNDFYHPLGATTTPCSRAALSPRRQSTVNYHAGPSAYSGNLQSGISTAFRSGGFGTSGNEVYDNDMRSPSLYERADTTLSSESLRGLPPAPPPPASNLYSSNPYSDRGKRPEALCRPLEPQYGAPMPEQSQHFNAQPYAAPFSQGDYKVAPVAQLLNYPLQDTAEWYEQARQLNLQGPATWVPGPSSGIVSAPHLHHLSAYNPHNGFPALTTANSSPDSLSESPWNLVGATVSGNGSPVLEAHSDPEWTHGDCPGISQQSSAPVSAAYHPMHNSSSRQRRNERQCTTKKQATPGQALTKRAPKLKVSKRKGKLNQGSRDKARQLRQQGGGCIRCQMYKLSCDVGIEPCRECTRVLPNGRVFKQPCYKMPWPTLSLVRHSNTSAGNGRFNQSKAEFVDYDWEHDRPVQIMDIVWNLPSFGPLQANTPLRIRYRRYRPRNVTLNTTMSIWKTENGNVHHLQQPPYAGCDNAGLLSDTEHFFQKNLTSVLTWIPHRVQNDELAQATYQEVLRLSPTSELIRIALQIQCLSIVSQGNGTVKSNDIPGIQSLDNANLERTGYEAYDRNSCDRPLPTAIGHQIDVAILAHLGRLSGIMVKRLKAKVPGQGVKPWYEIFLALFVLLWNLEYIKYGAKKYITTKAGTAFEYQVTSVVSEQIRDWEEAPQSLLVYWRCMLRDGRPIRTARENPEALRGLEQVDEPGIRYLMNVAAILDRAGNDRYAPPLSDPTRWSLNSQWIRELLRAADDQE